MILRTVEINLNFVLSTLESSGTHLYQLEIKRLELGGDHCNTEAYSCDKTRASSLSCHWPSENNNVAVVGEWQQHVVCW